MSSWVFGYGSLIYKPGFEYRRKVVGYIKGYRRVFYQGSTDHRGTPDSPGRTVTLEPCTGATTYLEWREKQYDIRERVDVYTEGSAHQPVVLEVLVYIASTDRTRNKNYLGPAPLEEIAATIATAVGPSGPNYEYLHRLADAMREIGVHDEELFWLDERVKVLRDVPVKDSSTSEGGPDVIHVTVSAV